MKPQIQKEHRHKVLELPELLSGILVIFVVLWEACFEGAANSPAERDAFIGSSHLILCGLVWFNTFIVFLHLIMEWIRYGLPGRFLWVQLFVGVVASSIFYGGLWDVFDRWAFLPSLVCSFLLGGFSIGTLGAIIRDRRHGPVKGASRWSPAVRFFTYMVVLVFISTLLLLTPGATYKPISVVDALFTCASATSITGLTTVNVGSTFTPLGKMVVLLDIQVGAIGVMTFSYFVLMMVGKRIAVSDTISVSGYLDQEGVNIVPALLRAVFFVTLTAEIVGAVCLYNLWKGMPGFPQDNLWGYAIFHAVSAFCNAGIDIFPAGMQQQGVANCRAAQAVMISLVFIGTVGFGVYLEGIMRLKNRLAGKHSAKRWSTNSWLVIRVMLITMTTGTVGLILLAAFEPSVHLAQGSFNFWESLWNATGRSAGFALTDISEYGPVYQLFLTLLMFVGGNPAGTGGGVYAPVFALCVLEVHRVLQGKQDLEIHNRRIARNTVERAMSTVMLSIFWIVLTTFTLLLVESEIARQPNGIIKLLFMEVSAFTTTGFELGALPHVCDVSKLIITVNMLFGRVGMFTFMLIFIRQKDPSPIRLPETRLPLT